MISSRVKSILVGRSEAGVVPYFAAAGGLFVTFMVGSVAYHGLLERAVRGWPTLTERSVLAIGSHEIAYADLTWGVYLGLFGVSLAVAGFAAMQNEGVLVSVFWAIAPFLGYMVGATLYYSRFTYGGYALGATTEWTLPVMVGLLYGTTMGLFGFVIGRIVSAIA